MDCSLPGSSAHGIFQARTLGVLPFPSPNAQKDQGKNCLGQDLIPCLPHSEVYNFSPFYILTIACTHGLGHLLGGWLCDVTLLWLPVEGHSLFREPVQYHRWVYRFHTFLFQILALHLASWGTLANHFSSVSQFPQPHLLYRSFMKLGWVSEYNAIRGTLGT